jgi:hypothetical protein
VLTGGSTFANGGWHGITVVTLESRTLTERSASPRPLDVVRLR